MTESPAQDLFDELLRIAALDNPKQELMRFLKDHRAEFRDLDRAYERIDKIRALL